MTAIKKLRARVICLFSKHRWIYNHPSLKGRRSCVACGRGERYTPENRKPWTKFTPSPKPAFEEKGGNPQ